MFSDRARFDLSPNRLAESLAARRSAGAPLIDLTQSNPTRVALPEPRELLGGLAADAARRYEPVPFGLPEARAAVARDFAGRGYPLDPERILLHASTSEAYGFLFKLLCDPGDEVLVPRPGYPLFDFLAGLESVRVQGYALAYDGEWHVDLEALARAVGSRTRAIVAVSPGNPTGAYLKHDELLGLESLCAERGIALVADEVFADFPLRDDPRHDVRIAAGGVRHDDLDRS